MPLPTPRPQGTCDGVLGEGLHIDEVVVGTVLLEPLAHVLLTPQDHRPRQAAQGGACVVQAIVVRVQPALRSRWVAAGVRWWEGQGLRWVRWVGTWGASVPGCCRSLTGRPPAALWLRESCHVRLVPGVRGRWQGMLSADTVCSRRVWQKLKCAAAAEHGCLIRVVRGRARGSSLCKPAPCSTHPPSNKGEGPKPPKVERKRAKAVLSTPPSPKMTNWEHLSSSECIWGAGWILLRLERQCAHQGA